MPHNDTITNANSAGNAKHLLMSGQFTTTVKTSQTHFGQFNDVGDVSWDGADTPFIAKTDSVAPSTPTQAALYLVSGQFSSTVKTSVRPLPLFGQINPLGISFDGTNTPWSTPFVLSLPFFDQPAELFLQSGRFTTTIKTSQIVTGIAARPSSVSYDGTNTPWCSQTNAVDTVSKLFLQSGQFTSTVKTSEDMAAIDDLPTGITYDGTNTPWQGSEADKFYLTSGQYTSTLKTSLASGFVLGIETNALHFSADVAGTIVTSPANDTDIVAGGKTIILQLNTGRLPVQSDTWGATVGDDNAITQAIIDGLTSSGAEPFGWNLVVRNNLVFGDVVRTSDTIVTITLPAFALYSITIAEAIVVTIPASALVGGNGPLVAQPTFAITLLSLSNNDTLWCETDFAGGSEKLYLTSGQFTSTIKDSQDVEPTGDPIGIATTTVDTVWCRNDSPRLYLQSGIFTSTVKVSLLVNTVDNQTQGVSWDNTNTPMAGNQNDKLYLLSGQFTTTVKDSVAAQNDPRGVSWDGTNTPYADHFIIGVSKLVLFSGQFTSTVKASETVTGTDSGIGGISFSGGTGDTPWCGAQSDKLFLTSGQFSSTLRDSQDESGRTNGMADIDVNDRLASGGALSVALIGSVVEEIDEQDVRDGGRTIILVVTGDTWDATLGADNAVTQALIDGLLSDGGEGSGWNAIVLAGLNAGNVARTSDIICTITLPVFATYDISGNETITANVPAVALTGGVAAVAAPTFTIDFIPIGRPAPRPIIAADQMKEYVTFVSPNGDRYPLNTPHQFGRWVISYSGLGTPPIEYITQRGPFQDGVTVKDFFLGPRLIQLLIRQEFCDRLDWWNGRAALLDAIRPNRQLTATGTVPGVLEWCLPDGRRRQINTFITEGPRFEPRELGTWDELAFQEALRFVAHDPLFFDPIEVVAAFVLLLDSDLVFPITFPIQFGSGEVSDTLNITYVGTWKTFPTIVITGPLENPIIRNVTTGEKLEFAIDIASGRTITIDLAYGVKTVVDDLGNNLIGNLSADSNLATWHLAPDPEATDGLNVITLSGLNPTGATSVELRYFTRYFGF